MDRFVPLALTAFLLGRSSIPEEDEEDEDDQGKEEEFPSSGDVELSFRRC